LPEEASWTGKKEAKDPETSPATTLSSKSFEDFMKESVSGRVFGSRMKRCAGVALHDQRAKLYNQHSSISDSINWLDK